MLLNPPPFGHDTCPDRAFSNLRGPASASPPPCFGTNTEYDEFQKQSSVSSQASVDFGSLESGQTSPIAINKRSSAKRVERQPSNLDRIAENREAHNGARSVSPPPVATSGRSKSPKSKSKRDSGSRSPDRYPVSVVDPTTGRLSKARSSCDVSVQPMTLSSSYGDLPDPSRPRRTGSTAYSSGYDNRGSPLDSSQYPSQAGTVASYVSSNPMSFSDNGVLGGMGLVDRPLSLDGSPSSFMHNALLSGIPISLHDISPLSPHETSPHNEESGSLSTSSIFSMSKPGSLSPEQRLTRDGRSPASGPPVGAPGTSSHSASSGISAPGNTSSSHSPHLSSQPQFALPSNGTNLSQSQPPSAAQRVIDSKLGGPDRAFNGVLGTVYEPSASESERDTTQTRRNGGLGGVSPVLGSLLSPADEYLLQSVNNALVDTLSISDPSTTSTAYSLSNTGSTSVNSTSSSGGIAAFASGNASTNSSVNGKRTRYSTSHSRRSDNISSGGNGPSASVPAAIGSKAEGSSPNSTGGVAHQVTTTASFTSPEIPRHRSRSFTSSTNGGQDGDDYLQGYPQGQQYAHIPQSDRPIPIIMARSHSNVYSGNQSPNTMVHDGGSTSPGSKRAQRRAGAYSAEGVLVSALQGTSPDGENSAETASSASYDDAPRGRSMSTRSGARSSRSTSPMAYMGEGRLLQNTAARTPVPALEDYFLIEDASVHFKLLEKLGKGSFGNVYIAKRRKDKSGKRYAIKKSLIDSKRRAQTICREIGNLRNSEHVNIVQFKGSYYHKDVAWIIMEYLDAGTLRDLRSCCNLKEEHIAYIMRELLKGLEYMHRNGTMHRDLKGENILLSSQGVVKIADLGLAVPAQEDQKRIAGSKYWMAPEMILAAGYGPKADLYSLGCTAYELADGLPPYAQYSAIRALFCAAKHGFPPLESPAAWSKDFQSFLDTCTHPNPRDRPTCDALLGHPFLLKACTQTEFAKLIAHAFALDYSGYVI